MSSLTPPTQTSPTSHGQVHCAPGLSSFVLSAGLAPPYSTEVWAELGTSDIHRELLKEEGIWGLGGISI